MALKLNEARKQAPPAAGGAWADRLRATVAAAIEDTEVEAIVKKQVEKAMAGDAAAAKFVLGLFMNQPKVVVKKVVVNKGGKSRKGGGEKALARVRRLAALHLHQHGPTENDALAVVVGLPAQKLNGALRYCDWFVRNESRWVLTPAGRQAVA